MGSYKYICKCCGVVNTLDPIMENDHPKYDSFLSECQKCGTTNEGAMPEVEEDEDIEEAKRYYKFMGLDNICEDCGEPLHKNGKTIWCVNGCFENDIRNDMSEDAFEQNQSLF